MRYTNNLLSDWIESNITGTERLTITEIYLFNCSLRKYFSGGHCFFR